MKLGGTVDLPGVGNVDKRIIYGVGGVAALFVGWKWWQSRSAAAYDPEAVDPGMTDAGTLPAVAGAVPGDNSFGLGGGEAPSTDTYGFTGKNNSQWTQYVTTQLVQSDRWSYTDIVTALGQFLANKPLTTDQMAIVQAGLAVAGYPPEGSHVIIPGGGVPILVAPTGVSGTANSDTAITVKWSAVAGASGYQVFHGSASPLAASGTSAQVTGLAPATSYDFQVAALAAGGQLGPKSGTVTVKTKAKPTTPGTTAKPFNPPKVTIPTPAKKKYPTRWKTVANGRNSNYSKIAAKYKLGISGTELYQYQFTSQAGRPASTQATLHKYGPNLIYAAGSTVLPYPK